jgi:hypothetical protein
MSMISTSCFAWGAMCVQGGAVFPCRSRPPSIMLSSTAAAAHAHASQRNLHLAPVTHLSSPLLHAVTGDWLPDGLRNDRAWLVRVWITSFRCPSPWRKPLCAGCQAPPLLHPRTPCPDCAGVVRRLLPGSHPTDLPELQGAHACLHLSISSWDMSAASAHCYAWWGRAPV